MFGSPIVKNNHFSTKNKVLVGTKCDLNVKFKIHEITLSGVMASILDATLFVNQS